MDSLVNPHLAPLVEKLEGSALTTSFTAKFIKYLDNEEISLEMIKKQSFRGIPDDPPGLRGIIWRILLGFLPTKSAHWESSLSAHRANYSIFKEELMHMGNEAISSDDDSIWEVIEKDIRRTRQDMHFFFTPSDKTLTYHDVLLGNFPTRKYSRRYLTGFMEIFEGSNGIYMEELSQNPDIEKHVDVEARILYIYAKLNTGIKYVQGMNELVAPIYYLFAQETHPLFRGHAEADAFFCFNAVVSRMRDTFVNSLDSTDSGLHGQLMRLSELIKKHDLEIYEMLQKMKISTQFFGIKWIVLLLSQELWLPDLFRLWDCLFIDADPFNFLLYVCLVLLFESREEIMTGDFAVALCKIQRPDILNINEVIDKAQILYLKDHQDEYDHNS